MILTPELLVEMKRLAGNSGGMGFMHKGHEVKVSTKDLINHIETQQAEIERLRAALENIVARDVYPDLNINGAEIYRIAKESLTPAELGEMAGKAEVVEEPLGIRVLQYLASADEPKTNFEVQDELHAFVNFVMVAHLKDRLIYRNNGKYSITAAGRDYLASLDDDIEDEDTKLDRLAMRKMKEDYAGWVDFD